MLNPGSHPSILPQMSHARQVKEHNAGAMAQLPASSCKEGGQLCSPAPICPKAKTVGERFFWKPSMRSAPRPVPEALIRCCYLGGLMLERHCHLNQAGQAFPPALCPHPIIYLGPLYKAVA